MRQAQLASIELLLGYGVERVDEGPFVVGGADAVDVMAGLHGLIGVLAGWFPARVAVREAQPLAQQVRLALGDVVRHAGGPFQIFQLRRRQIAVHDDDLRLFVRAWGSLDGVIRFVIV